jgi:hypothetical protein
MRRTFMISLFAFSTIFVAACVSESGDADPTVQSESEELVAAPAATAPRCTQVCGVTVPCDTRCTDAEGTLTTCEDIGRCSTGDGDGDGVLTPVDNCPRAANPDQADCDGDGRGDVCDADNGTFVAVSDQACMDDEDGFPFYGRIEYWHEKKMVDVSACHSPPHYSRYVRYTNRCVNLTPFGCCVTGTSLQQHPDEYALCNHISQNFCH